MSGPTWRNLLSRLRKISIFFILALFSIHPSQTFGIFTLLKLNFRIIHEKGFFLKGIRFDQSKIVVSISICKKAVSIIFSEETQERHLVIKQLPWR